MPDAHRATSRLPAYAPTPLKTPRSRPEPSSPSSLPLELFPLPWLSLPPCSPPHRTAPTPPTSTTTAIAFPSSSRAVQELRHDLLFIFAETNDAGAPRSAVIVVAFVLCTDSRRRRFAATRPPPTSPWSYTTPGALHRRHRCRLLPRTRRPSSSIRRLRTIPDLAERPLVIAVSH